MATSKSQWTLVASEPDEYQTYDQAISYGTPARRRGISAPWHKFMAWRTRHGYLGWRFGVQLGLLLTTAILLLNIGMTAGVISYYGMDSMGKASLTKGSCADVKKYNTLYHLFINVLSTLLIGASNYTMQMLSAPTRSEVDQAHSKGRRLDIGVPSWRNLKQISSARVTLWVVLSLSSIPLHLFFNSAVFVTLNQHSYSIAEIAPSFFQGDALSVYPVSELSKSIASSPYSVSDLHELATNGSLTRVDKNDCIREALVPINTQNLLYLLVEVGDPDKLYNTSDLQYRGWVDTQHTISGDVQCESEPGDWACRQLDAATTAKGQRSCELCSPRISQLTPKTTKWTPYGTQIDYCLNLRAEDQCALEFSIPIMVIICAMNFVKVFLFAFIGFFFKDDPIVTLGDAIASYIGRPSSADIPPAYAPANTQAAVAPEEKQRRWAATTKRRWTFAFLALAVAEAIVIFWLIYAAFATGRGSGLFSIPFAQVDPRTIIYSWTVPSVGVSAVMQNALIANIAQPVLSAIYFAFNGLITAMCSANEWNTYAREMKGLRVSGVPTGAQRSTHFLQLPYRYGVPLMVLSVLTHWMVSQAIFVVSVLNDGRLNLGGIDLDYPYYVTCGYSPPAIVGVIVLGLSILVYSIVIGSMPLKERHMPVAGSNSMAIERQCVLEIQKYGLEKKALQWGVRPSEKRQYHYVAGFSDLPISGGEKELRSMQNRGPTRYRDDFVR